MIELIDGNLFDGFYVQWRTKLRYNVSISKNFVQ